MMLLFHMIFVSQQISREKAALKCDAIKRQERIIKGRKRNQARTQIRHVNQLRTQKRNYVMQRQAESLENPASMPRAHWGLAMLANAITDLYRVNCASAGVDVIRAMLVSVTICQSVWEPESLAGIVIKRTMKIPFLTRNLIWSVDCQNNQNILDYACKSL